MSGARLRLAHTMALLTRDLIGLCVWIPVVMAASSCSVPPTPVIATTPARSTTAPPATVTPSRTVTPPPTETPVPLPTPAFDQTLGLGSASGPFVSPDGTYAVIGVGSALQILPSADGIASQAIELPDDSPIDGVVFSPNSRFVAVQTFQGFTLIDHDDATVMRSFGSMNGIAGVTFSRDNRWLAYRMLERTTGGSYHFISVVPLDDLEAGKTFDVQEPDLYHWMSDPVLAPDGAWVSAGASDGAVYIWDGASGETRYRLTGHASTISSVALSPDGQMLASGSLDGTVRLWDPAQGRLIRVVTGLPDDVASVSFTAEGTRLRIEFVDAPAAIWDLHTRTLEQQAPAMDVKVPPAVRGRLHTQGYSDELLGSLDQVAFNPARPMVALGTGSVLLWNTDTHQLWAALEAPASGTSLIVALAFSPDGRWLAAANRDRQLVVWDLTSLPAPGKTPAVLTPTWFRPVDQPGEAGFSIGTGIAESDQLVFSPDSTWIAAGNGSRIDILGAATGELLKSLQESGFAGRLARVSVAPDGRLLYAVGTDNRHVQIWDVDGAALVRAYDLPEHDPNAFSSSALQGSRFARNNYDETGYWIELWDLTTQTSIRLPTRSRETDGLALSPDGAFLFAISQGLLHLWQTDPARILWVGTDAYSSVSLAASADRGQLAIGRDGVVDLWSLQALRDRMRSGPYVAPLVPPTETPYASDFYSTPEPLPTLAMTAASLPSPVPGAITTDNVDEVREVDRFGAGTVEDMRWSTDGSQVLVAGSLGVRRYSSDLQLLDTLPSAGWTHSAVFDESGTIRAVDQRGQGVVVWRSADTAPLAAWPLLAGAVLSPSGTHLVADSLQGLQVLEVAGDGPVVLLRNGGYGVGERVFSPNGHWVAAATGRRGARVWDATTGLIQASLGGPKAWITDLAFSADSRDVIGAAGGSAFLWNVASVDSPRELALFPARASGNLVLFDDTISAVALDPLGRYLAVATSQHQIRLFDRGSLDERRVFAGDADLVSRLVFSPDGQWLLSADRVGRLRVWQVSNGVLVAESRDLIAGLAGIVARADGGFQVWSDGTTWALAAHEPDALSVVDIPTGTIQAASPAGDLVAVSQGMQMELWSVVDGTLVRPLNQEATTPFVDYYDEGRIFPGFWGAAFSLDGRRVASAGTGGVWIQETATGTLIAQAPAEYARLVRFSPDGRFVFRCDNDLRCHFSLYDTRKGDDAIPYIDESWSRAIAFSPSGRTFAVVPWTSDDEPIRLSLFSTETAEKRSELVISNHARPLSVAFSPDERLLAVGYEDGTIDLVDVDRFVALTTLPGHRGQVIDLAFARDGRTLASISTDGTVRFWGVP